MSAHYDRDEAPEDATCGFFVQKQGGAIEGLFEERSKDPLIVTINVVVVNDGVAPAAT